MKIRKNFWLLLLHFRINNHKIGKLPLHTAIIVFIRDQPETKHFLVLVLALVFAKNTKNMYCLA